MRRKRTHAGATPFKRDGKQIGYRAQVTHPITGKKVSANKVLGLKPEIYRTATEASDICVRADETLAKLNPGGNVTVATLRERWLATGWAKESSAVTNANRTRRFCELHADLPAALLDEGHWFEFEGGTPYHLEGLKTMLNWGASTKSGRLIPRNPLADIATGSKKGNRKKNPPSIAETDQLIAAAYEAWPGYGAWIEFACYTGARPGEIDGLKWSDLSADGSEIRIRRQFSATTSTFTLPKNGEERTVILSPRAKRALAKARQLSDGKPFVFVNTRGGHFRPAARTHYWETVVELVKWEKKPTLYLATRHFAGWFMLNVLRQTCEDIALALGHTDGGDLVRKLYGHLDEGAARKRVADAYAEHEQAERAKRKRNLRPVDGEGEAAA
jgi:integrase